MGYYREKESGAFEISSAVIGHRFTLYDNQLVGFAKLHPPYWANLKSWAKGLTNRTPPRSEPSLKSSLSTTGI